MDLKQKHASLSDKAFNYGHLNGKLSLLSGTDKNNRFDVGKWIFSRQSKRANETYILDFSLFDLKCFVFFEPIEAEIDGEKTILTTQKLFFFINVKEEHPLRIFTEFLTYYLKLFLS